MEFPTCTARPTGKRSREALEGLPWGLVRGLWPGDDRRENDRRENHQRVAPAFHTDLSRAPRVLPSPRSPSRIHSRGGRWELRANIPDANVPRTQAAACNARGSLLGGWKQHRSLCLAA